MGVEHSAEGGNIVIIKGKRVKLVKKAVAII